MASNYAMLMVPNAKSGGKVMAQVECRHVKDVPGPGDEEVAFDLGLDPKAYDENVTVAGTLTKLISNGRKYDFARTSAISDLAELEDILVDLKDDNVQMSGSSRLALFNHCIDCVHHIGQILDFRMQLGCKED